LCGQVYLVTGGYAVDLRQWGEPLPPSRDWFDNQNWSNH
jgi:adenosylcobinamide kinase/adenosylcobinamide-phosphate guanylyltransferase